MRPLTPELLTEVAARFKVLSEPARLAVLDSLRAGPLHVSALMEQTGLSQANLSKHLQLLHAHGVVARRREGLFVYYAIADQSVFQLCDVICGNLERAMKERLTRFGVNGDRRRVRSTRRLHGRRANRASGV